MTHDLRVAARRIAKAPLFSAAVVLTLALCIGANTAIYSVIDNVLLRPLAYPEPDRLAEIGIRFQTPSHQGLETSVDGRTGFTIRDRANLLDAALSEATRSVDPLLPLSEFRALDEVKAGSLAVQRLLATLLGTLSSLALLLTALGVFGLLANSVAERSRELGIRLALGSTVNRAIRTALRPGLVYSLTGLAIGLLLSLWTTRLAKGLLWGVQQNDPLTFVTVVFTLLAIALLAGLIPAARIARINPAASLRDE